MRFPASSDWLYGAGLLSPDLDPVAQLSTLNERRKALHAGEGTGDDGKMTSGEGDEGGAGEVVKTVEWEGAAVLPLLSHPAAVRTTLQKRTQAALLGELTRVQKSVFNSSLEATRAAKKDALKAIAARHERMRAVLQELGRKVTHVTAAAAAVARFRRHVPVGAGAAAVLFATGRLREGARDANRGGGARLDACEVKEEVVENKAEVAHDAETLSSKPGGGDRGDPLDIGGDDTPSSLFTTAADGAMSIGAVPSSDADGATVIVIVDPSLLPDEEDAGALAAASDDIEIGLGPYVSKESLAKQAAALAAAAALRSSSSSRASQERSNKSLPHSISKLPRRTRGTTCCPSRSRLLRSTPRSSSPPRSNAGRPLQRTTPSSRARTSCSPSRRRPSSP